MMVILFPHHVMQVIIVLLVPVISHALLVDGCLLCPAGSFCNANSSYPHICPENYSCPQETTVPIEELIVLQEQNILLFVILVTRQLTKVSSLRLLASMAMYIYSCGDPECLEFRTS